MTSLPQGGGQSTTYSTSTLTDFYTTLTSSSSRHDQKMLDNLARVNRKCLFNDPQGATFVDKAYDSSSRTQSVSTPYRSTTDPTYGLETPTYDGLNRVTSVTHADGFTAQTFYGAAVGGGGGITSQLCASGTYGLGFPVLSVDEAGKKRQTWTDGFGRSLEVDEPDSSNNLTVSTCYKYDLNHNLTEVDQGSETRTYAYDGLSRQTAATTPESGTTNFYFTNSTGGLCSGNLQAVCRRTDARSITTTYAYDAENRVTSKTYSDSTPTVTYFYDQTSYNGLTITNGKGRRTGMSDGSGATAWSYDSVGEVLTRFTVLGAIPSAAAVSSTESPPKYRSSTMRVCRSSICASRSSASSRASSSADFASETSNVSSSEAFSPAPPRLALRVVFQGLPIVPPRLPVHARRGFLLNRIVRGGVAGTRLSWRRQGSGWRIS